jgi:D-cysteine desulfhydrase family pyridoxal phosphate-dependent enzyme
MNPSMHRVALAQLPTPLERADRLSAALDNEIWLKRDDLTGLGLGGNKVRKLEFLLGDALARDCDTVVTFGALQSNHARQTAAACARLGLRCELVLTRAVPRAGDAFTAGGNVLLDQIFGANLTVVAPDDARLEAAVADVRSRLATEGRTAYWIPPGGSNAVGTLGYVAAGEELAEQLDAVGLVESDVVVAVSTGGTVAGLWLGLRRAGRTDRVRGVDVYRTEDRTGPVVHELVAGVAALIADSGSDQLPELIDSELIDIELTDEFLGPGYGMPTAGMVDAVRLLGGTEGIAADPVYSGKALDAVATWATDGRLGPDRPTVIVLTGGAPALFAYADEFRTVTPPGTRPG